jgi:hypothetical protein
VRSPRECTNENRIPHRYRGGRVDAGCVRRHLKQCRGRRTVLQTDTASGVMTPIYVGMNNPHGLIFIPN